MKTGSLFLLAASILGQPMAQFNDEVAQGVALYRTNRYAEAVEHLQRAMAINPSSLEAQSYLASAYMVQWVPGLDSSQNGKNHDIAVSQFQGVLDKDPKNAGALASLASMAYNSASTGSPEQRAAALDDAFRWNQRRRDANPNEPEPYYYLGVIAWSKSFTPIQQARIEAKMQASDLGPISELPARISLQSQYLESINGGIANMEKCLEFDTQNDDAMSYLNLLLREKADLEDSAELAKADIAEADRWVLKSLETKRQKASVQPGRANGTSVVEPAPAAPALMPRQAPPSAAPRSNFDAHPRIAAQVAEENLIHKVPPIYPALAKSARVQGLVDFLILISPEGKVENVQLVRGHPLLVNAAREALLQWKYRPFLLDGRPVSVVADVVITLALADQADER